MIVITMLPIKATIAFIIVLAFSVTTTTTTTTVAAATVTTYPHHKEHSIPTFSISDLRRLSLLSNNNNNNNNKNDKIARIDEFREALSTTGLLAVRLDDDDDYGPQDNSSNSNNNNNNNMEENYSRDRRIALDGLCSCIDHPEFLKLDQTHELILPKSTTKRTSVATATVGLDHPLPLPNGLEETCGIEIVSAMEGLRDVVATVSKVFISAVDTTIILGGDGSKKSTTTTTTTLLRDEQRGKSYKSITDIVSAANHLEHFHVYTNNQEKVDDGKAKRETAHTDDDNNNNRNSNINNNNVAWDWHTDAGLFLVFVPAWDCNNNNGNDNSIDESFYYRDGRDGTPIRAKFDGGRTAIVMLGQGAQDWLNLPSSSSSSSSSVESKKQAPLLKATSHSVRWDDDDNNNNNNNNNNDKSSSSYFMEQQQQQSQSQRRAWYGMMHLVPETAMIYGAKTLREVKQTLSLSHQKKNDYQPSSSHSDIDIDIDTGVSLGCGNVLSSSSSLVSLQDEEDYFVAGQQPNTNSRISRRRLSEHQDPSMCNNVTNFFCWMTCMDVPKPGQAELYIDAGYSLYCLDEAVLAKTGNLSAAYEPCIERHDMACKGEWEKTVEGVPAANINVTSNPSDVVYPFCYGGTTMYMEGFQWIQSSTCVVLLFPSWVLNSSWKYILAVIATFLCALGLEKFIQQRRKVMAYMESGTYRLFVSALFYGIQLSVGYLLMLIIMIYSFVLFMAVILGLVSGHILFNAKDAIWPIHESLNLDEIDAALDSNSDNNDDSDNRDETVADSFAGNGSNGSNGSNGDINSNRNEKSSFRNSTFSSSSATKVQMNLLANASEERALGEGSTHCQEFDDNEYYGSMDEIKDEEKAFVSAATASKLKKEQTKNNKAKRNSNHDVPEGSTPCCQQGM